MRKTKKLSIILAIVMVLSLFPILSLGTALAAPTLEINPVNNLNPMRYTVNGGPGSPVFRNHFRYKTENTFIRPGESVTYVYKLTEETGEPVWSITGGVGATAISSDGKLTVDAAQPAGDIIVTATVGTLSTSAKVTVRIVSDAHGYDRTAKWGVESFKLSEVNLDNSLWTKNRDIMFRYLLQGNREEKHLKFFYDTAGITELPVAINGRAAGSAVSALTAPDSWDGIGYASTSRVAKTFGGAWDRALPERHFPGVSGDLRSRAKGGIPEQNETDDRSARLYQRRDDSPLLGGGKVRSFGGSSISHRSGVIAEALILFNIQRACAR